MSEAKITLTWQRKTPDFNYKTYDRTHTIHFSGGSHIQVSASADFLGDPQIASPGELLLAALASCHMLTFLALAAHKKLVIDEYNDTLISIVGKNAEGQKTIKQVILQPQIRFSGEQPNAENLHELHEKAHKTCFIANSVNFPIKIESA